MTPRFTRGRPLRSGGGHLERRWLDGAPPSARAYHTAVWTGSEMIVWGGWDGGYEADGGRYDPVTDSWTPLARPARLPAFG